jgi:type IV pilus assembly protein PilA
MARALQLHVPVSRPLVKRQTHGFTLIELMIVVVIVGILATLAVVGYRRLIQSSHVSEATGMVQSIRVAQESYHSETQQYANISSCFPSGVNAATCLYPATPVYGIATTWGAPCTSGCNSPWDWSMLPVHVDGPVLFGYATQGGPPASTANGTNVPASPVANGISLNFPTAPTTDWFVIAAEADLDNNPANFTDVFTTSWSNQVWISNEGQ